MTRDRYPQRRYFLICLFAAVFVLTCGLASAQDPPSTATADIPFDFYISGVKMAAGPYTLDRIKLQPHVLLRSQDGKSQQDLLLPANLPRPPRTFRRSCCLRCGTASIICPASGARTANRSFPLSLPRLAIKPKTCRSSRSKKLWPNRHRVCNSYLSRQMEPHELRFSRRAPEDCAS